MCPYLLSGKETGSGRGGHLSRATQLVRSTAGIHAACIVTVAALPVTQNNEHCLTVSMGQGLGWDSGKIPGRFEGWELEPSEG